VDAGGVSVEDLSNKLANSIGASNRLRQSGQDQRVSDHRPCRRAQCVVGELSVPYTPWPRTSALGAYKPVNIPAARRVDQARLLGPEKLK
jgi:hypothetical protein